jgi:hypothetical protein
MNQPVRACTCHEHRNGAPTVDGSHEFTLDEENHGSFGTCWRPRCLCGYRGHWQYQSGSVAYHSWLRHVASAKKRGQL